jgi:large subunit ribosomal protein L9
MEVILLERIAKLGQMGDVVKVKPGFARNFLLPKKKALRATEANRKYFETKRAQLEAQNLAQRGEAEKVSAKLDGLAVVLIRQAGEGGQLYGSVSARDIAAAVTQAGFTVERRQVELNQPIKAVGIHKVAVDLHPEVRVTVTVNVARSPEEAEIQAKTGTAVIHGEQPKAEEETDQTAEMFEEGAAPSKEAEEAPAAETSASGAEPAPEVEASEPAEQGKSKKQKKKKS